MEKEELRTAVIRCRAKNSLTIKEFAEYCGVHFLTILRFEKYGCNLQRRTQAKIELCLEKRGLKK